MIEAVIFDLDDTLYPESAWRSSGFDAVADYVSANGFERDIVRSDLDDLDQLGDRANVIDALCERLDCQFSAPELVQVFRLHRPTSLTWFPGARSFVERCALPTALVTDGLWESQIRKIEALGLRDLLDVIVPTDLLGQGRRNWKPSTVPFEVALNALDIQPDRSVYIADNPQKDFGGPESLGMHSIWLRQPGQVVRPAPLANDPRPTYSAMSWQQVEQIVYST